MRQELFGACFQLLDDQDNFRTARDYIFPIIHRNCETLNGADVTQLSRFNELSGRPIHKVNCRSRSIYTFFESSRSNLKHTITSESLLSKLNSRT